MANVTSKNICDCERSHNGLGIAGRECDCPAGMDPDLREALETLSDFRQFWFDNVRQSRCGAAHDNPMWARVAEVLEKRGMNGSPGYFRPDPAYRGER